MIEMVEKKCWEDAYLVQGFDAAVGRLFRGLVHNLNGVMQAFVMQTDLMELMFPQAEKLLDELEAGIPAGGDKEPLEALRSLLRGRADIVAQAPEKVRLGQDILLRVQPFSFFLKSLQQERVTVNDIVRSCVEFLAADSFFKHQVEKGLRLTDDLPPLQGFQAETFEVVLVLLENAMDALKAAGGPARLDITTVLAGEDCLLEVENTGPAIAAADQERLFSPCFTTREGHAGMGLPLARRLAEAMGGSLSLTNSPGSIRFSFRIPVLVKANGTGHGGGR